MLVLDEALPHPPDSGKRLRTWHLLRRLAQRHELVLLAYGSGSAAADRTAMAALSAVGIECQLVAPPPDPRNWRLYARLLGTCISAWPYSVAKHHTARMESALETLWGQRRFDLLQVEWTPVASHLRRFSPPHVIASHNIEAQIWRRRASVSATTAAKVFFHWQAEKMQRFERAAFRRAAFVTTVSQPERHQAAALGARATRVVANGVDLESFHPRRCAPAQDRLLFLGALDWHPNQDAIEYYLAEIAPRLRALRPQARLQVVGRRPTARLRRLLQCQPGVELVGEVEDVRPLLAGANAVVVPLRIGGGSRIKILEALAMEKAVVSTRVGAEGLELSDGLHLRLADEPEKFAQAASELLAAPALAAELGRAGGAWVRRHHGWDACAASLEKAWREALAHGGGAA
ncbi:MAG: glycosyltransferase [Terriglobales bacterium]